MTQTFSIALYQTDIAQNFGSVVRTAVAFGVPVHLIEPCGFLWNEPKMRRAGMDYLDRAELTRHKSWAEFQKAKPYRRLVAITTKGSTVLPEFKLAAGDCYLFGRESSGLPEDVHKASDARIRIPMTQGERSINLAQSAAIVMYAAMQP